MFDFFEFGGDFGGHGGGSWLDALFGHSGGAGRSASFLDDLGGGFFDSIHGARSGAAFEEFAGLGARAGRAGWSFSRFFSEIESILGHAIDAQLLHDMYTRRNQGSGAGFSGTASSTAEKAMATEIREVITGHGFIAAELKKHTNLSDLANQYHQLGTSLPAEDLLNDAYRRLSSLYHPDKNPHGNELMQRLNAARDALTDSTKRSCYERYASESPDVLERIFSKLRASDFEKAYVHVTQKPRLLLSGPPAKPPTEGFGKWAHELSPAAKSGLILGSILTAGVGIYAAAKWRERSAKNQRALNQTAFVSEGNTSEANQETFSARVAQQHTQQRQQGR